MVRGDAPCGTPYDLITIGLFAGFGDLFFYSNPASAEAPKDKIIHYLPPAVGTVPPPTGLGNNGYGL